jgi:hypothetical protein
MRGHRLSLVPLWGLLAAGISMAYEPAINFQLQCMGCHLADGSGERGRVPSIRSSVAVLLASAEGREYVVRVPGVAQSPLSDEDTAALLNWVAHNLSAVPLPANFVDYSVREVQRLRSQPLAQVRETRARLMKQGAMADRHGGALAPDINHRVWSKQPD